MLWMRETTHGKVWEQQAAKCTQSRLGAHVCPRLTLCTVFLLVIHLLWSQESYKGHGAHAKTSIHSPGYRVTLLEAGLRPSTAGAQRTGMTDGVPTSPGPGCKNIQDRLAKQADAMDKVPSLFLPPLCLVSGDEVGTSSTHILLGVFSLWNWSGIIYWLFSYGAKNVWKGNNRNGKKKRWGGVIWDIKEHKINSSIQMLFPVTSKKTTIISCFKCVYGRVE